MPTRLYEGPSIDTLLERVRAEAGAQAKIIRAQKVRKGGILGFFARELFELTVEVPEGVKTPSRPYVRGRTGRTVPGRAPGRARPPRPRTAESKDAPNEADRADPTDDDLFASLPSVYEEADGDARLTRPASAADLARRRYSAFGGPSAPGSPGDGDRAPSAGGPGGPVGTGGQGTGGQGTGGQGTGGQGTGGPVGTGAGDLDEDTFTRAWEGEVTEEEPAATADAGAGPAGGSTLRPDNVAMRYWAYFLVPRGPGESAPDRPAPTPVNRAPHEVVDLTHPVPSTETAAFTDVLESLSDDPRPAPASPTSRGRALEPVRVTPGTDYLDDLSAMDSEELVAVGEAPVLPPEVIRILTRIPIAGLLPPGSPPSAAWRATHGESDDAWRSSLPGWHPGSSALSAAAWGRPGYPARMAPGDVFASTPFMPTGLASIGFPAALIPDPALSELAGRLGDPEVDLDSTELARDLFVEALKVLPAVPEIPDGAGRLLAVVGEPTQARRLAARLANERGVDPAEVVVAAPEGTQSDVPAWMLIPTEEVAAKRRLRWSGKDKVTIVAVSASLSSADRGWARAVLEALEPDLVCGVVESTHKPEDIASWAIELGRVDTLAIEGGRATRTPAAVLACGIPVALIDGEEADTELWSRIVADRLATC